jgi:uncharacterized membrane protein
MNTKEEIPFRKENYVYILSGLIVVIIGFLLMAGGGSENPQDFNPEIFSARRITFAPITVLVGFGIVMVGILKKSKEESNS